MDVRELLADLLTDLGCSVRSAGTGAEALRLAAERPDAVIIDIGLPDLPGYELAVRIRAIHGASVRIVAATGYPREFVFDDRGAAAFDEILTKPITFDTWARVVASLRPAG